MVPADQNYGQSALTRAVNTMVLALWRHLTHLQSGMSSLVMDISDEIMENMVFVRVQCTFPCLFHISHNCIV